MKALLPALLILLCAACQKKSDHHHGDARAVDNTENPLYREVINIHDEGMALMDSLYKTKRSLQTRLEMPGLSTNDKEDLMLKIARIDSADNGMRVWMRQFDPPADSALQESYLQSELTKVRKVRDDIHRALESAQ